MSHHSELAFLVHVEVRCDAGMIKRIDAEMAEALALCEGLIVAKRLACHNLIVQSDCTSVVEALNSELGLHRFHRIFWKSVVNFAKTSERSLFNTVIEILIPLLMAS